MVCAPLRQEISRLRAITEPKISIPISTCSSARNDRAAGSSPSFQSPRIQEYVKKWYAPLCGRRFLDSEPQQNPKHLSPYPRTAPLEMTERQAAYHHFKPHGYRNASKKRLRRNDCHFSQSLFICSYFILASTEGVGARFSETSGSSLKPPDFLSCFSLFFSMKW